MNIQIRAYQSKDAALAAQIWNEVVADGNAFPQDTEMTADAANHFFLEQTYTGIAEDTEPMKSLDFISCIQIMLEDVVTSVMPAMLSGKISAGCISVKSWFLTV